MCVCVCVFVCAPPFYREWHKRFISNHQIMIRWKHLSIKYQSYEINMTQPYEFIASNWPHFFIYILFFFTVQCTEEYLLTIHNYNVFNDLCLKVLSIIIYYLKLHENACSNEKIPLRSTSFSIIFWSAMNKCHYAPSHPL